MIDALMIGCILFPERLIARQNKYDCDVELHGSLTRGQVAINRINGTPNVNVIELLNLDAAKEVLLWTVEPTWVNMPSSSGKKSTIELIG